MLGRSEEGREEQDFHDQVEKALETETLVLMSLWVLSPPPPGPRARHHFTAPLGPCWAS